MRCGPPSHRKGLPKDLMIDKNGGAGCGLAGYLLKIATFNVNGVNGRLPALLRWLAQSKPEVACQGRGRHRIQPSIITGTAEWTHRTVCDQLGAPHRVDV